MIHLDLFSGIGGFAYAVDQVWPGVEHIFCDNDKFCQQVLKKHWHNSKIYGDIRTITDPTDAGTEKMREWKDEVFILTGGFPCQPFSQAGQRKGTSDDRYLWPEMLRVIQLAKPQWVIAENVRGLLTQQGGVVFEQVCLDLEACGYEVQPLVIPAVAVNAPHRRDRVWFIAFNSEYARQYGTENRESSFEGSDNHTTGQDKDEQSKRPALAWNDAKNPIGQRSGGRVESGRQILECETTQAKNERSDWEKDWFEVASELCGVDDGLSPELDFAGWTKSRHRVERLKSLGNSIVPQVAIEILKSIKYASKRIQN